MDRNHAGTQTLAAAAQRAFEVWHKEAPSSSSSGSPPVNAMIEYHGTGLVWHGLALWGRKPGTDETQFPRADVGLQIRRPSSTALLTGKMWVPAIYIGECDTGILADGDSGGLSADSCAFGYYWSHGCHTAVELDGAGATMFTFRYIHPLLVPKAGEPDNIAFKVTGGGRVYTHSMNILDIDTVLEISGGDMTNSFFHINGATFDGNAKNVTLLKNHDDGNGLTHVRFTNAHFTNSGSDQIAKIDIDRSNSTSGQTVVELVGCRGVAMNGGVLQENVVIKGTSTSNPSRLIVRDSELAEDAPLINPNTEMDPDLDSSAYTINRIKNWLFHDGLQDDASESG